MSTIFYSIFSLVFLGVLLQFLIRQSVWTRWVLPMIQRKPKLQILFDDGLDVRHIAPVAVPSVEDVVNESMELERQQHPAQIYQEPIYENLMAFFDGPSENKKIFNNLLHIYLTKKEEMYRVTAQAQVDDQYLIPVRLQMRNDGCVAAGKMKITFKPDNKQHLYAEEAKKQVTIKTVKPPVYCGENVIPPMSLDAETTNVECWDLTSCMKDDIVINLDFLHHHDTYKLPTLYVDSRHKGKVLIDWEIIEQNIDTPLTGELVLWID